MIDTVITLFSDVLILYIELQVAGFVRHVLYIDNSKAHDLEKAQCIIKYISNILYKKPKDVFV